MSVMTKQKLDLAITPATEADFPAIIAIARETWPIAYREMLSAEQLANLLARIYCDENLKYEMMLGHSFWLAQVDGKPVAYASAYIEKDAIWLKKLYVLPAMQQRGIGRRLMETVTAAFPDKRELRLLTNPENHEGKRFYAREGFVCVGEMPVQMGDFHFTDLIFAKLLPR